MYYPSKHLLLIFLIVLLLTIQSSLAKPKKFYFDSYQNGNDGGLEEMCEFTKPTLRILLRGLATLLLHLCPECAPQVQSNKVSKPEESIKVFRQIMACPPMYPPQQMVPPQVFPQPTLPSQGFAQSTVPSQSFPQQTFPPQGFQQQILPGQGFPQQSIPSQVFPHQTLPPQTFSSSSTFPTITTSDLVR